MGQIFHKNSLKFSVEAGNFGGIQTTLGGFIEKSLVTLAHSLKIEDSEKIKNENSKKMDLKLSFSNPKAMASVVCGHKMSEQS